MKKKKIYFIVIENKLKIKIFVLLIRILSIKIFIIITIFKSAKKRNTKLKKYI